MRISELQNLIARIITTNPTSIYDLLEDAKKLALELMKESNFNAEFLVQYFEGALLEIFILATLLQIDIEKLVENSIMRITTKAFGSLAE